MDDKNIAWRELFFKAALAANCLPSSFIDANGHVFKAIEQAFQTTASTPIYQEWIGSAWVDVEQEQYEGAKVDKRRIVYAQAPQPDAQSVRDAGIHTCGLPMSVNPHPEAGVPGRYLETGCQRECIPCLVLSRHQWSKRAVTAEKELRDLKSAPPQKPVSDEVKP